jgi:hypothetical protein
MSPHRLTSPAPTVAEVAAHRRRQALVLAPAAVVLLGVSFVQLWRTGFGVVGVLVAALAIAAAAGGGLIGVARWKVRRERALQAIVGPRGFVAAAVVPGEPVVRAVLVGDAGVGVVPLGRRATLEHLFWLWSDVEDVDVVRVGGRPGVRVAFVDGNSLDVVLPTATFVTCRADLARRTAGEIRARLA